MASAAIQHKAVLATHRLIGGKDTTPNIFASVLILPQGCPIDSGHIHQCQEYGKCDCRLHEGSVFAATLYKRHFQLMVNRLSQIVARWVRRFLTRRSMVMSTALFARHRLGVIVRRISAMVRQLGLIGLVLLVVSSAAFAQAKESRSSSVSPSDGKTCADLKQLKAALIRDGVTAIKESQIVNGGTQNFPTTVVSLQLLARARSTLRFGFPSKHGMDDFWRKAVVAPEGTSTLIPAMMCWRRTSRWSLRILGMRRLMISGPRICKKLKLISRFAPLT